MCLVVVVCSLMCCLGRVFVVRLCGMMRCWVVVWVVVVLVCCLICWCGSRG